MNQITLHEVGLKSGYRGHHKLEAGSSHRATGHPPALAQGFVSFGVAMAYPIKESSAKVR